MKVYVVLYRNLLDLDIFCGLFGSRDNAQVFADSLEKLNPELDYYVEEWEVRGEE